MSIPIMTNLINNQMKPNEKEIVFMESLIIFFWIRLSVFVILNEILIFFLRF